MEKLPMCRICLIEDVRMYVVVNRNLHKLYEKLTDIPFVTEDSRPILVCFFCCTKLKQCYTLLRKCLEAEELFAQMMNEDYEPNALINQEHLEFFSGFITSPIEHVSIDDECQTEGIAIKEEFSSFCDRLDDIIEPMKEHQSEEREPGNSDNNCLDVADLPPHHSDSDLEDDAPLMEFQTEVEGEQEVSQKKRRGRKKKRATVTKKSRLNTRRTNLEDAITAEQTKNEKSDSKVIRTSQKLTSKPDICFKEPYKCDQCGFNRVKTYIQYARTQICEKHYECDVCQRSFKKKSNLTQHIRIHTGERPYKCEVCQHSFGNKSNLSKHFRIHTGQKPYTCDVCQRSFREKGQLRKHILIHTGEKPYKCDVCLSRFRLKGTLTKHTVIHHG